MIYLDCAASTPIHQEVAETVMRVMLDYEGNPSSPHASGQKSAQLLQAAREQMANVIGTEAEQIIFTSGGTESNHLAIHGTVARNAKRTRHIVTTAAEHPSVLQTCKQLATHDDVEVTIVPVNRQGFVSADEILEAVNERTVLVSMVHANSEIGTLQPIAEVGERLRAHRQIMFHVDASQTLGKVPLDVERNGIDLLTASAHKWHGPKGTGFLYVRNRLRLQSQMVGGGQQFGLRAGTENVATIAGMAKAMRLCANESEERRTRLYKLRKYWLDELATIPCVSITGDEQSTNMAPHIVHICLKGYRAQIIVRALSAKQIYVSSQSACSSQSGSPSALLMAMGMSEEVARSGIRISYDEHLQVSQIQSVCAQLRETLAQTIR